MSDPRGKAGWERLFRLVFEQSSHPIALLDEDRRIVDVNDAAVSLWRGSRDDLIGTSIADTITPSEQPLAASEWREFLRSGDYAGARDLIRADGSEVQVDFAARSAQVGDRRLAVYVATTRAEPSPTPQVRAELPLTNREREVVTLIALGRETDEIAEELHISRETVRSHVRNAMSKLGAHTRAQLVAIALCADSTLNEDCVQTG